MMKTYYLDTVYISFEYYKKEKNITKLYYIDDIRQKL